MFLNTWTFQICGKQSPFFFGYNHDQNQRGKYLTLPTAYLLFPQQPCLVWAARRLTSCVTSPPEWPSYSCPFCCPWQSARVGKNYEKGKLLNCITAGCLKLWMRHFREKRECGQVWLSLLWCLESVCITSFQEPCLPSSCVWWPSASSCKMLGYIFGHLKLPLALLGKKSIHYFWSLYIL